MLSKRTRIAAPFVVTGLIAAGAWLPTLRASASPHLRSIPASHLVEKVLSEKVSHLSGTFEWSADLGLPSLSDLTGGGGQSVATATGFDPTSLLSGTHTFEVWIDGSQRERVAAPGTLSETDLVRSGRQAWVYDSSTNHVTHYVLPRPSSRLPSAPPAARSGLWLERVGVARLADELLRSVRSVGSDVSVGRPVEVAGRAAYVLRIAPDRSIPANRASTVSAATIAVDATTGLPLRVSIYAAGQSRPALQVGFSSISYATPSRSVFAAPTGQSTTTKILRSQPSTATESSRTRGWVGYARLPQVSGSEQIAPPTIAPGPQPIDRHPSEVAWGRFNAGPSRPVSESLGRDWGTIRVLSAPDLDGSAAGELASVTTVVSGRWGSGRLLTSSLVNALFLPDGQVLVGLVTPAALEAAAHSAH